MIITEPGRRVARPAVFYACLLASFLLTAPSLLAQQDTRPRQVTFCAYNLKNWLTSEQTLGGGKTRTLTKPEAEKAHIVSFLTAIKPDVLGVCEIGAQEDLADLQARLKQQGLDLPHSEWTHGGDPSRSLALLSRFAISARHSRSALKYHIGDAVHLMQRGILDVQVDVTPDFQVSFVGVHLKSKRTLPDADEALMRRNEAHLLRTHLDTLFEASPQAHVICYGDFNEHRHEPAIAEIIGSRASPGYMGDVSLSDFSGLVWTHFWDTADVYSRFDYIFTSRALRPHLDFKRSYIYSTRDFDLGSDHRPIVLTFRPSPAPAPAAGAAEDASGTKQ